MEVDVEHRMAAGTIALTASGLLASLLGLIFSIVIARLLGPEGYGLVGLAFTYPSLLISLLDMGLGGIVAKYAASRSGYNRIHVWTGILAKAVLGALGAIITYFCADYFAQLLARPYVASYIKILSPYVFASSLLGAFSMALSGLGRYWLSGSTSIMYYALKGPLAVGLILLGYGVLGVVVSHTISYVALSIVYTLIILMTLGKPAFSKRALSEVLVQALPLHVASLSGLFVGPVISTLLARHASNYEIGNFNVAGASLTPVNIAISAISVAALTTMPLINGNDLESKTSQILVYSLAISSAVIAGYAAVLAPLILVFYGSSYAKAPAYALVQLAGLVANALFTGFVLGSFFVVMGNTKWNAVVGVIYATSTVASALVLVPLYGPLGAAASYAVGQLFSGLAACVVAMRLYRLRVDLASSVRFLAPAALAFALSYLASRSLSTRPFVSLFISGTTYLASYMLVLPLIAGKKRTENLVMIIEKLPYIGHLLKPLSNSYSKFMNALFFKSKEQPD
ncbi:MAG: oligosaccharide flippase family protein [Desulfurococcaceae archaeon]